jgi:hypothetical protein
MLSDAKHRQLSFATSSSIVNRPIIRSSGDPLLLITMAPFGGKDLGCSFQEFFLPS